MRDSIVKTANVAVIGLLLLPVACASSRRAWEEARKQDSIESYTGFLATDPPTVYADSARTRVDQLKTAVDWDECKEENTAAAYATFLDNHPLAEPALRKEAQSRLDTLRRKAQMLGEELARNSRLLTEEEVAGIPARLASVLAPLKVQELFGASRSQELQEVFGASRSQATTAETITEARDASTVIAAYKIWSEGKLVRVDVSTFLGTPMMALIGSKGPSVDVLSARDPQSDGICPLVGFANVTLWRPDSVEVYTKEPGGVRRATASRPK